MTALFLFASLAAPAATSDRPNLVVIVADDLGWRDLGCYGSTLYQTPNIDRLASRGLLFTHAFTSSPLCSPTRASLLTGQHVARHGISTPACHIPAVRLEASLPARAAPTQRVIQPQTATRLPLDATTYAEVLRDAGYRTAFFGKWHLGLMPYTPENQGFEVVWGGRGAPGPPGGFFAPWSPPGEPGKPASRAEAAKFFPAVADGTHVDDAMTDQAIEFLRDQATAADPFLLNYWMYSVHAPFEAKENLVEKYRGRIAEGVAGAQQNPVMAAMIETMDTNVGRLLEEIDRLDMADDTIVIFTSDNGGNTYNFTNGVQVTDNSPLRNGKGNIHDGGVRVPQIVRWPGLVEGGTKTGVVTSSVDLFPTLLEVTNVAADGLVLDGESLVPTLRGETASDRVAFTHFPHGPPATGSRPGVSVHRGDWKLTRYFADGDEQADRHVLYDLSADPGESRDKSARHSDIVGELSGLIDDYLVSSGGPVPKPNPNWTAANDGWKPNQDATVALNRVAGSLKIHSDGNDPFIQTDGLRGKPGRVFAEVRWRRTGEGDARLYFAAKNQPFARERSVALAPAGDGEWTTERVEFAPLKPVGRLRLDPLASPGTAEIDWLRIISEDSTGRGKVDMHWDF